MIDKVTARISSRMIPTYKLGNPEINPVFFEKRVYQGSSGRVYPVPFIDKVYKNKEEKDYREALLENKYVKLSMLPEIGGRIFEGRDKTNNNYDFFYRQEVIKPALVGLAGPWISGGVEFNWPQHHRPGTFLPCDVYIEDESDGAKTVWLSEYDPMNRLKGMHGIRLRPDSSLIELRGRLYNRTPITQTFLWWANVAVKVHENYQSFFPPDVHYVADHAVRAMSSFPNANNPYYGIPYQEMPENNDLRKYKNIPVPTSYMVCDTNFNFFGGYDFKSQGGFIHVANRHIAPGKKQWTWGSEDFGKAWDRELTDSGGPYFELMAGVYTDNQPDFSYLHPFETKTFSQFWWSYKKLGPVQNANRDVALKLQIEKGNKVLLGVASSKKMTDLRAVYQSGDKKEEIHIKEVSPDNPWLEERNFRSGEENRLSISLKNQEGKVILSYYNTEIEKIRNRQVAKEPDKPEYCVSSNDLELIGEHLDLYRHPTRYPEEYWEKAIEIDPKNYRANISLSKHKLKIGLFEESRYYARQAVDILTHHHPNPSIGEAHYYYGLSSFYLDDFEVAYTAFYKSTWNYEWRAPGYLMLAKLDIINEEYQTALEHLDASLVTNTQNNSAYILKAVALNLLGKHKESMEVLNQLIKEDPLDQWANFELGIQRGEYSEFFDLSRNDSQTIIDIALEYIECGLYKRAKELILLHKNNPSTEAAVPNPLGNSIMPEIILARIYFSSGMSTEGEKELNKIESSTFDYFFPSRIGEMRVLEWLVKKKKSYSILKYGLGNYYYNTKRYSEAITVWQDAANNGCTYATLHRNLGIAHWNISHEPEKARQCYLRAIELSPNDMRIQFEYDQLRKKLGDDVQERLKDLLLLGNKITERDDLCVELASLYNVNAKYTDAKRLLESRTFHPWEGGEGKVLKQYTFACLKIGQAELKNNNPSKALSLFKKSFETPDNLGEKYHPLQSTSHINYWKAKAFKALKKDVEAKRIFEQSAGEKTDFIDMSVSDFSEMTYYKIISLNELGKEKLALKTAQAMKKHGKEKLSKKAEIDYFATSLPQLLVFDEDLQKRNQEEAYYLIGLSEICLGNSVEAKKYFDKVLKINPAHAGASDFSKMEDLSFES